MTVVPVCTRAVACTCTLSATDPLLPLVPTSPPVFAFVQPRQPVGNGSGQAGKEPQEGEGESWIECRLKVASATDAFLPTRAGETSLGGDVLAGVTGGGSGSGHRSRLQEVEVRKVAIWVCR